MSVKYAKLKKDWVLRGWTDAPMVVANLVNGDVRKLQQKSFYIADSCDGVTNFNSLAFISNHHDLLDLLIKEDIAEECQEGDSIQSYQLYRKANNPRITEIHWCVTGRCNLNCRHCYMQSTSGRYGELPFTEMVRLIEQFEQANVLQVSLSGGEPFIRKDIIDIIELLANKKIWLSYIYSNGLLITEDHLKEIKRVGFAPNFQISFDGVGVHDQMRGVYGVESGVIESIKRIRDVGFPLIIATSIDKTNIERLAETYELLKELGIQSWRIGTPRDAGNWRGATTALQLDEQAKACEQLLNRWLKDGKPFYIQLAGFYAGGPLLNEATSICDLGLATSAPTDSVCSESTGDYLPDTADFTPNCYDCIACREQPNLLPDGTLVPCPGYVDIVELETMPNLLREGLSKAWSKSYLREIVDLKKKDLLTKNPECAICELFKNCGMGCRALAFTETGDLMAKDPISCELWKNGIKKRFEDLAMAETSRG